MTYQTELQRLVGAKASMRASIIAKGVDVPEDVMIEDLPDYIAQIEVGGSSWDPDNPTLEGLKYAIDNDIDVAIGTEIPDVYDGNDNPLIVAQKLDSSNNSSYGGAEGVILVRKYVEPTSQGWGGTSATSYGASAVKSFLDTTYYDNSSAEIKNLISPITLKVLGSTLTNNKWFAMSTIELGFYFLNVSEGIFFDYWKDKTGLSSPNDNSNAGRILRSRDGVARNTWMRTVYQGFPRYVNTNGENNNASVIGNMGILPACFIAKGGN